MSTRAALLIRRNPSPFAQGPFVVGRSETFGACSRSRSELAANPPVVTTTALAVAVEPSANDSTKRSGVGDSEATGEARRTVMRGDDWIRAIRADVMA